MESALLFPLLWPGSPTGEAPERAVPLPVPAAIAAEAPQGAIKD